MNPKITNRNEIDNIITFTLEGVNVCIANAIRRVVLSEISTFVFKTFPYEENNCNFIKNTTLFNNEVLKQRLSCIPIHIKEINIPLDNYIMELNVKNETNEILNVTSNDFKIKNINTNEYLSKEKMKEIFPPFIPIDKNVEYYVSFVKLRPKISEEIAGEHINLTCKFSLGTAKEDGMFNVVGTCSYGNTIDDVKVNNELKLRVIQWKEQHKDNKEDIENEIKNWKLLEGLRYFKQNSFDFIIQTLGVFSNSEILYKACEVIIQKINVIEMSISNNEIKIKKSKNTMDNCYDIVLENEDYTIGNLLQFVLFSKFYEENKILNYCGFKKEHPHDSNSIIRLAYIEQVNEENIKLNLNAVNIIVLNIFNKLKDMFLQK